MKFSRFKRLGACMTAFGLLLSLSGGIYSAGAAEETLGETEPYILYISRIESPGKNHLNLIRAFELLPERLASRCRLVCAGAD